MADIFVSYKRDDLAKVSALVTALRESGFTVWWDRDIAPGAPWEATIEQELEQAGVAIVAWSPAAIKSENVKGEARAARNRGKLLQIYVAPCEPPLFFGERQGVDLTDWKGDRKDPRLQMIVVAAQAVLRGEVPPDGVGYQAGTRLRRRYGLFAAAVLSVAALFATALFSRDYLAPKTIDTPKEKSVDARRAHLINSIGGSWDRQDGDCTVPITIKPIIDRINGDSIVVSNARGFRSSGTIIAAENGAIVSRDVSVNENGRRQQWEYRPSKSDMTVIDGNGVATKLVRCALP